MEYKTSALKPVLVTGSPRSGTTWVGLMLATSPQLYYVHEPFNPDHPPGRGVCNIRFSHYQTYITDSNEKRYFKPIQRMVDGCYDLPAAILESRSLADIKKVWGQKKQYDGYGRQGMRPVIKDPIALMSAGWLARRFDLQVVVMIRHPAAFVASMKRLNWGFDPTRWALSQKMLLSDYIAPLEDELRNLERHPGDVIDQAALLWKTAYHVVSMYIQEYPDWIFLKHEEISHQPLASYKQLFSKLGLAFTSEVQAQIREHSNASNPSHASGTEKLTKLNSRKVISQWKKVLSVEEILRIKAIVGDVADRFYTQSEWEPYNASQTQP
jgi:hypothetical protein